jgi:NAD(P)-dependent dehydrogenase (short-subunit alcohol dehydrogenase family)
MTQRIALVTGSAQGIGRAIAEALSASGHVVVGVDVIDQDRGPLDRVVTADLAERDAAERLRAEVGHVDVLVNNAAILVEKPIEETSIDEFDLTMAVNLRAPFLLSRAFGAGMRERGWGRIINIASIAARTGGTSQVAAYGASKAGLVALTKNFARNYGPDGVTVNVVCPAGILTPMADAQERANPGTRATTAALFALRRNAEPSEVATVVDFLASDGASYMTGATVDVNGGWFMY